MHRPNILHLFTDQQRFDTIRALGGWVQTPHIDRLAGEGTAFSRAYTPCAECVPARACMITGKYADKTGCYSNADAMPAAETPTFMSLLRNQGYRTHGVGKCHFTPDPWAMRGFDSRDTCEEIAEDPANDDYLTYLADKGYTHILEPHGPRGEMYYIPQPSQLPAADHPTQWVGDRAIDFIRRSSSHAEPWYLYAGFIHPHPPFAPPNPWHKLYRAPEMPLPYQPANRDELICFINRFQNRYKYRDRGIDLNLVRCIRAYYAACISFIDYQVGRILDTLQSVGVLDSTLIVFSADHGELLGDFDCFGKRSFHEVSQRVPLIARLPGYFPAAHICNQPASLVDLMPTFLSAANVALPDDLDGSDLHALAIGQARHSPVLFHYARNNDALLGIIGNAGKFAWSAADQQEFYFQADQFPECANQIANPALAGEIQPLRRALMERCASSTHSRSAIDASANDWQSYPIRSMPDNPDAGLLFQDPPTATPTLPDAYTFTCPRPNFLGF